VKCPEKPSRLPGLAAVHVGLENDTDLLAVAGVQEERKMLNINAKYSAGFQCVNGRLHQDKAIGRCAIQDHD
jgi:hypothetical protein